VVKRSFAESYLFFLLRHRAGVIVALTLLTAVLGFYTTHARVRTDFFSLYPPNHPYIRLYRQYREMFGTANVLAVAVEVKSGTIFNYRTIEKIDRITRFLLESPGVDPNQVISLTHGKLKDIRATAWGVQIRPVVWPSLPTTQADLDRIRDGVHTNRGIHGFFVSPDDRAALIFAGFWEEGTDLTTLFERVRMLESAESDEDHAIYVTGYPVLFAWVVHYLAYASVVVAATFGAIAVLLWFYFRTWTGVWVPLLSGLLSTVWATGLAGLLGLNLDPLALVVVMLITARALSHSVQSMERYHGEYALRGDRTAAIVASYTALFAPATVSIASDGLAILTLSTASIPLIQYIAWISSFWIFTIALSVVTLHPVLLSILGPPAIDERYGERFSDRIYAAINAASARASSGRARYAVLAVAVASTAGGLILGHGLKVGDTSIGKALLYDDHPYNRAFDFLNRNFVGSAELVVVAEGREPGALRDARVLERLERLGRHMEGDPASGGSLTVTSMLKRLFRMFHEGEPRWEILPSNPDHLAQMFFMIESSTTKEEMARLYDRDYRNASVRVFYRDSSNQTIKNAIARAEEFLSGEGESAVRFRLAGGIMGILAAVNQEVESSYAFNLYLVLFTVFVLSFLTYRSVTGALIVMIPSLVAQPMSEAVMVVAGIDLNINSLPVAAVGIGIGIDYGYYVLSRIVEELKESRDFDVANRRALMTTGRAIVFTGTTLVVSVIFWLWFPMKFHAEMALLLGFLLFFHVVGALVLIPTFVSLSRPRFASALAEQTGAGARRRDQWPAPDARRAAPSSRRT
jgi:uncharacterized protein